MKKETFYLAMGGFLFIAGVVIEGIIFLGDRPVDKWIVSLGALPFIGAALLIRPDFLDKAVTKIPGIKSGD